MGTRDTALRFFEAHQKRDAAAIEKLCSDQMRVHGPGWEIIGIEHYLESQSLIWKELPTQQIVPEYVIDAKDATVIQWLDRCEHPNTDGKPCNVIMAGCSVIRFQGDKIVDVAVYSDSVDLIHQLS